jgi:hypothetical protein
MIKFVGAAVWICIATLVAVYFSFQMSGSKPETDGHEAAATVTVETVKTEVMSVPLIREGLVAGYFLARLVFTVDSKEMKKLQVPADSLITDQVYSYIYSAPELDFSKVASLDIDAFRNGMRDGINKKLQLELVKDVLIEQIDYLTKDDIREAALKRHAGPQKKEPEKPKDDGHDAPAH